MKIFKIKMSDTIDIIGGDKAQIKYTEKSEIDPENTNFGINGNKANYQFKNISSVDIENSINNIDMSKEMSDKDFYDKIKNSQLISYRGFDDMNNLDFYDIKFDRNELANIINNSYVEKTMTTNNTKDTTENTVNNKLNRMASIIFDIDFNPDKFDGNYYYPTDLNAMYLSTYEHADEVKKLTRMVKEDPNGLMNLLSEKLKPIKRSDNEFDKTIIELAKKSRNLSKINTINRNYGYLKHIDFDKINNRTKHDEYTEMMFQILHKYYDKSDIYNRTKNIKDIRSRAYKCEEILLAEIIWQAYDEMLKLVFVNIPILHSDPILRTENDVFEDTIYVAIDGMYRESAGDDPNCPIWLKKDKGDSGLEYFAVHSPEGIFADPTPLNFRDFFHGVVSNVYNRYFTNLCQSVLSDIIGHLTKDHKLVDVVSAIQNDDKIKLNELGFLKIYKVVDGEPDVEHGKYDIEKLQEFFNTSLRPWRNVLKSEVNSLEKKYENLKAENKIEKVNNNDIRQMKINDIIEDVYNMPIIDVTGVRLTESERFAYMKSMDIEKLKSYNKTYESIEGTYKTFDNNKFLKLLESSDKFQDSNVLRSINLKYSNIQSYEILDGEFSLRLKYIASPTNEYIVNSQLTSSNKDIEYDEKTGKKKFVHSNNVNVKLIRNYTDILKEFMSKYDEFSKEKFLQYIIDNNLIDATPNNDKEAISDADIVKSYLKEHGWQYPNAYDKDTDDRIILHWGPTITEDWHQIDKYALSLDKEALKYGATSSRNIPDEDKDVESSPTLLAAGKDGKEFIDYIHSKYPENFKLIQHLVSGRDTFRFYYDIANDAMAFKNDDEFFAKFEKIYNSYVSSNTPSGYNPHNKKKYITVVGLAKPDKIDEKAMKEAEEIVNIETFGNASNDDRYKTKAVEAKTIEHVKNEGLHELRNSPVVDPNDIPKPLHGDVLQGTSMKTKEINIVQSGLYKIEYPENGQAEVTSLSNHYVFNPNELETIKVAGNNFINKLSDIFKKYNATLSGLDIQAISITHTSLNKSIDISWVRDDIKDILKDAIANKMDPLEDCKKLYSSIFKCNPSSVNVIMD